jgi:hypothetical protein
MREAALTFKKAEAMAKGLASQNPPSHLLRSSSIKK